LAYHNWPRGLDQYASKIFEVLACPHPECLADVEQYHLDIPAVFRALKAWEDELEEYMGRDSLHVGSASPNPFKEEARQRKRKAEEDWSDASGKVNRIRTQENAHHLLQEDDMPMAQ
jgi:hypothetical protein